MGVAQSHARAAARGGVQAQTPSPASTLALHRSPMPSSSGRLSTLGRVRGASIDETMSDPGYLRLWCTLVPGILPAPGPRRASAGRSWLVGVFINQKSHCTLLERRADFGERLSASDGKADTFICSPDHTRLSKGLLVLHLLLLLPMMEVRISSLAHLPVLKAEGAVCCYWQTTRERWNR